MHIRVLGFGSTHGDDIAGWQLVERLKHLPNVHAVAVRQTVDALDYFENCSTAILIDACTGGGIPGTLSRLVWPDPSICSRHARSTHGLGIGEVLQLAASLHVLPASVVIHGIEVDPRTCRPGQPMSAPVLEAIDQLQRHVLHEHDRATSQANLPLGNQ